MQTLKPILILITILLLWNGTSAEPQAVGDHAIQFTGVRPPTNGGIDQSGYIAVPYDSDLNGSYTEFTVEAWVKRNADDRNETIVGNGWSSSYWLGFSAAGRVRFIAHGSDSITDSDATVGANKWTHVAAVYDGAATTFYIDGILDSVKTPNVAGAIAPANVGQPLGIGRDRTDTFSPNYFAGSIDNVRIWKAIRTPQEIAGGMFQEYGAGVFGLLGEWQLNGDATDATGNANGVLRGQATYSNEGALPNNIHIPQVAVTPSLNANCSEYGSGTQITLDGSPVYLLHTATDLWVCIDNLGSANSTSLYLDPPLSRIDPAQAEHLRLRVFDSNTTTSYSGNGSGSYTVDASLDSQWDGIYSVCCGEFPTASAEFRISHDLVGGWDHVVGLAVDKFTNGSPPFSFGVRRVWPALATYNHPSTWSLATLGGVGVERTYLGRVVYQPRDAAAAPVGVAGTDVMVIGSSGDSEAIVAVTTSDIFGNFSITTNSGFDSHRLELGAPPSGYAVQEASADPPATVIDPRTIDFADMGAGTTSSNIFTLDDQLPSVFDPTNGTVFLIIAPDNILDSDALNEFVAYKRRLGFAVILHSVEQIAATYGGDLHTAIRADEQQVLATYGDRFQYVMLVGSHETIPFMHVTPWFTGKDNDGNLDLDACLAPPNTENANQNGIKIKLTDWYYVDLTSNFDSNGNGCLLDGSRGNAENFAASYTPDFWPNFDATVALGRIPFDDPTAVEDALATSMRFEQQSEAFKQETLHAMSNVFLQGQYWDGSATQNCPGGVDKNCQGSTTDAAYVSEEARLNFLSPLNFDVTTLYEGMQPPGAWGGSPTSPLTKANLLTEFANDDYGFVNMAGHGNSIGVYRTYWSADLNNNGLVDSPTAQGEDEISGGQLFSIYDVGSIDNGDYGAIFSLAACSTGKPLNPNNLGASLLMSGEGVAWVGALSMVNVGSWVNASNHAYALGVQYYVMQRLLNNNLRMGDALWQTLEEQANTISVGSSELATDLYGDPTLSYWGNPGGQSTYAAWPMLRHNPQGHGFNGLSGPTNPSKQWTYAVVDNFSSPVISNNGEVIATSGNSLVVLREGALFQALPLDAGVYGSPAISADGTIYALDVNGKLYAFPYSTFKWDQFSFDSPLRERRWATQLPYSIQTSPVIGADGFVYVGQWNGTANLGRVTAVRPDGAITRSHDFAGRPLTDLAVAADRTVYVTAEIVGSVDGAYHQLDLFCGDSPCITTHLTDEEFETPPLLAYGNVYAGQARGTATNNHRVINLTTNSVAYVDAAIRGGPIAGPGGQIVVTTINGTVYSFTTDLTLRWQRNLGATTDGMPAFSADALYVLADGTLYALNPFSGNIMWSRALGDGYDGGHIAVNYGRELIVRAKGGDVHAYSDAFELVPKPWLLAAEPLIIGPSRQYMNLSWRTGVPDGSRSAAGERVVIQRSADGGAWQIRAIVPADDQQFTDESITNGENYAYRIQVVSADGNLSPFVQSLVETDALPSLPNTPVLDDAETISADAIQLTWHTDNSEVTTYRIERSETGGDPYTTVLTTTGDTGQAIDSGLTPHTRYYYRVIALNKMGQSNPSNVDATTTHDQTLSAPTNVVAALQPDGTIRVEWGGFAPMAEAVVEYSEGTQDGFAPLTTTSANSTRHAPGEPAQYQYRVKFVTDGLRATKNESVYVLSNVVEIDEPQQVPTRVGLQSVGVVEGRGVWVVGVVVLLMEMTRRQLRIALRRY